MLETDLGAKFDLMALADMTGMALVAAGAKPAVTAGADIQLLFGAGGKWCNKCPHPSSICFLDPNWGGASARIFTQECREEEGVAQVKD